MPVGDSGMIRLSLESGSPICMWNHVCRMEAAGCTMQDGIIENQHLTLNKQLLTSLFFLEHERE